MPSNTAIEKTDANILAANVRDQQAVIIAAIHVRQQRKAEWITSATADTPSASSALLVCKIVYTNPVRT